MILPFQRLFDLRILWWVLYLFSYPMYSDGYRGKATWYNTGLGSCGKISDDNQLVVALPASFSNTMCFKTITLTNAARPIGPKVKAVVVDKCMGCAGNDLDVSPAVFKALNLGNLDTGKIFIDWIAIE